MDEFIAEVARVQTWKAGPPVGSLGQHVRLKPEHEHFRLAVEKGLGGWNTLAGMAVRRSTCHHPCRSSHVPVSCVACYKLYRMVWYGMVWYGTSMVCMQVGCFEDERKLRAILAKYSTLKSLPVRVQACEARFQPQLDAWWSKLPKDVKALEAGSKRHLAAGRRRRHLVPGLPTPLSPLGSPRGAPCRPPQPGLKLLMSLPRSP